jgi:hypothetical protein
MQESLSQLFRPLSNKSLRPEQRGDHFDRRVGCPLHYDEVEKAHIELPQYQQIQNPIRTYKINKHIAMIYSSNRKIRGGETLSKITSIQQRGI